MLRSTSGTGLRQLASPFAPLVLDRGAVISLPSRSRARHPLPPTHTPPSSRLNPRCRSGKSSGSASGALTDDFMVELSSETTTAAIPGFPPPPPPPLQQTAAAGPAAGSTAPGAAAAAAVEYAVLTCQQDVDQAVAGAAVGGDVSAAEVYTGAAAVAGAGEEGGGIVGVGGGSVLGGVEEQASGMGEREAGGRSRVGFFGLCGSAMRACSLGLVVLSCDPDEIDCPAGAGSFNKCLGIRSTLFIRDTSTAPYTHNKNLLSPFISFVPLLPPARSADEGRVQPPRARPGPIGRRGPRRARSCRRSGRRRRARGLGGGEDGAGARGGAKAEVRVLRRGDRRLDRQCRQ